MAGLARSSGATAGGVYAGAGGAVYAGSGAGVYAGTCVAGGSVFGVNRTIDDGDDGIVEGSEPEVGLAATWSSS